MPCLPGKFVEQPGRQFRWQGRAPAGHVPEHLQEAVGGLAFQ